MRVNARIAFVDWTNPNDPKCLVVLSNSSKIIRIFRIKVKDVPNHIFRSINNAPIRAA
jgi:hypothetical protein